VIRVDVRLIAATNRDLLREVAAGRFREDLFYRLNVVTLFVPPLRERQEDIPLLAQEFLVRFAEKNRKPIRGFTPQAMDRLLRHPWPGNVRELMNAVERAVVLSRGEYLEESDLSLLPAGPGGAALPAGDQTAREKTAPQAASPLRTGAVSFDSPPAPAPPSLEAVERETILRTLEEAGGNKSETARRLGITRRTLHQKLRKYGMM
jgi:two-component system response regulator HydG